MSDTDFLALVEQGSEHWNQWRTDNPSVRPDLSHAYLFGHSLAKFDLSHTNLERACLIGTDLQGANLHGACLKSAYGSSANFNGANLSETDLSIGSFGEANFSNANLSKATVYGTNFSSACFSGACLLAWKLDASTVLSGVKGSHVYLEPQQQQRQPQTGEFQPGALEPFLRLVDAQQSSVIPQPTTSPRLSTALSLKAPLKAPINSTALKASAIKASVKRFKAGTIHQANQLLSDRFRAKVQAQAKARTAQISLLTQRLIQPENFRQLTQRLRSGALVRIRVINDSAVAQQLRVQFTPDAVARVTPGALHQLSPETITRIHKILKLEELTAFKLAAIQGSTRAKVGAFNQLQSVVYSDQLRSTRAIAQSLLQSAPVHRAIQPFKPDGVNQITPGALSQVDIKAISAAAFEQLCHQIQVLFTPDAVNRVTPGALHQLSPETRAHIHTVLKLDTIYTLQTNASNAGRKSLVVITSRLSLLTHTAAFKKADTLLKSQTAERLIQPFRPDGVDRVTPGSLPPVDLTALKSITTKAQTYSGHAIEHIKQPEKRAQLFQSACKLSNPKNLEANIKNLCERHPRATGLSTIAVVALLAVNFVKTPTNTPIVTSNLATNQAPGLTAQPSTAPKTATIQETTPQETAPPTASTASVSAVEVASQIASVTMPCQAITAPVSLNELENGYEYENGAVYYGQVANGQPSDGTGTMVYPTGNRYDGEYQGGQRQGCGTFTFANKRRYIGQFKGDKFSGQGTWIIENGERYIGEFKNNQCSGQGTFIFANGSSKSGTWQQGKLPNTKLSCDRGSLALPSSQDM